MYYRSTNNYLLIKDDVGRSKPSVRDLPGNNHAYGYSVIPDKEGVGACKYLIKLIECNSID